MIRPSPRASDVIVTTSLDGARSLISHAMRASDGESDSSGTLGEITLMPHQQDAVWRLQSALARFGGALLADDVGLGKTFVALSVARDYTRAHVLAPAALVSMWQASIARAGLHDVVVRSLHGFSAATGVVTSIDCAHDAHERELVVIDEAHYLRNRNTARYRAVSAFVAGRDVLLLSATPLHNASSDLRNLLGLFAGTRTDLLEPGLLAQLIVRREEALSLDGNRPDVIEHAPVPIAFDADTLSGLIALPAPLPAHDGAVAGALIRLGLLRAWCSSDAALTIALERRLLRGSALQHALESGRHPTNAELRTWLVGDADVQLAFPELMATQHVASGPLLAVLSQHVRAVSELLAHHRRVACGDPARVRALRDVLDAHPGVPVLAFSQFAGTVRSLFRALGDIAGVGAMSSERGHIASGPVTRSDVLARFAPIAQGVPPPPPHQALRLLLSTDVLAEGVNLQDAGVVVHLDFPWTDALLRQRVGRVVRIGSPHRKVHVHAFAIPDDVERVVRLLERVHEKAEHGFHLIGGERTPRSAAVLQSWVRARLDRWRTLPLTRASSAIPALGLHLSVAASNDEHSSWLALVRIGEERRLLAAPLPGLASGQPRDRRAGPDDTCDVSDDVQAIAHAIGAIDDLGSHVSSSEAAVNRVRPALHQGNTISAMAEVTHLLAAIRDWLDAQLLRQDAGTAPSALSAVHRRVQRQARAAVASAPSVHRARLARLANDVSAMLSQSCGIGAEASLEAWCSSRSALEPAEWLAGWTKYPLLASGASDARRREHATSEHAAGTDVRTGPQIDAEVEVLVLLAARPRER